MRSNKKSGHYFVAVVFFSTLTVLKLFRHHPILRHLHHCPLIPSPVNIVWSRKHCQCPPSMVPVIPLHEHLMSPHQSLHPVHRAPLLHHVLAECEPRPPIAEPPSLMIFWIAPHQVGHWPLLWYL